MSFDFLSLRRARPDAAAVVGLRRRHARADARHDRLRHDLPAPALRRTARSTCTRSISHFFRFWLWLTTGMVTKEWVAIHRKHHAKVRDRRTIRTARRRAASRRCFCAGTELYRAEAKNAETLEQVRPGHARRLDRAQRLHALSWEGVGLMLVVNLMLFGAARRHDLGGADDVDPGHGRRRHQRHRPLLGLPQLRHAPTRRRTSCRGAS